MQRENILDAQLAQDVLDAVGFKEVLSHTYGPIINDDIVYDTLQNSLHLYVDFSEGINEYLRE